MKAVITVVLCMVALILAGSLSQSGAQNPDLTPYMFSVGTGAHSLCTIQASTTRYCFASDGLWISENGGVYTKAGSFSGSVVTSFNGKTGDVTYTAPVATVNGKTGNVVITATTTIN